MESTSDTSFYSEDQSFPCKERMKNLKKSMTLDLDASSPKRQKFTCLLSTPDLNMLKFTSPELERLLIQQNSHITATPTPTQYVFPKNVTEEQESYVRGFVEALAELHSNQSTIEEGDNSSCDSNDNSKSGSQSEASSCVSSSSTAAQSNLMFAFSHVDQQRTKSLVNIKEEPQTVPKRGRGSPPMSPINLADQERIKLERKRLRNRMAATKCRRMKLEKISKLETKVKELKGDNDDLLGHVSKLKDRICYLKEQLMEHVNSGCKVMVPPEFLD